MCTYNIQIDDSKATVLQTRFKDSRSVEVWMQLQIDMLIADISRNERRSTEKMSMADAMSFVKTLAIPGAERIPADIKPIESLVAEKYA